MRELNIDWAALHSAFQMNMPEVRCFFAIEDGKVLKLPPGDPSLGQVRGDPQHFIAIEAIPSRIQYQWLDDFIHSITNPDVQERMLAAINGKGAFRRFKDILLTLPEERRRWFEWRDQKMRQRIVEWVHEQGIEPTNPAPWLDDPSYVAHATHESAAHQEFSLGNASSAHVSNYLGPQGFATHHDADDSVPDNVGNVAPAHVAKARSGQAIHNAPHEIEALRDFLIEWSDNRVEEATPGPLELEELADKIAKHFYVRSAHAS